MRMSLVRASSRSAISAAGRPSSASSTPIRARIPWAIDAPFESTTWISRSGSMSRAICALLIAPDRVPATLTETIASAPAAKAASNASLKSPGDAAAVLGNGASWATIRGGLVRAQVGRGVGEDRDTAQVGFLLGSWAGPCGHDTGRVQHRGGAATLLAMQRPLKFVLLGTFTLRFSTGLTGSMLAFYLAHLHEHGGPEVDGAVVGLYAALFYLAELVLSPLFGILSDRIGHHKVMLYGPVFGAIAVLLTAVTTNLVLLGGTRILEGASGAASVPSILGFIAMATAGDAVIRGTRSARFEAATLAGLGAGAIVGVKLFEIVGPTAFFFNAALYGVSFLIYKFGVSDPGGDKLAAT